MKKTFGDNSEVFTGVLTTVEIESTIHVSRHLVVIMFGKGSCKMKVQQKIMTMVIAALLCAIGIVIPMFCPKIILEPASFTLASHVALFLAMFISLPVSIIVCLGTTVGFFFAGFPLVVVLRALSQIVFVALGAWFLQHKKNVVNRVVPSTLFSLVMGIIHGACEMLVSSWFYFNGGENQQGYVVSVLLLVGVGTVIHSMVDYGIAVVVWRAVQNVVRIPVNVHLGRKKAAQSAA